MKKISLLVFASLLFFAVNGQIKEEVEYYNSDEEEQYEIYETEGERMTVDEALNYETNEDYRKPNPSINPNFKERYNSSDYDYTEKQQKPKPKLNKPPTAKSVNIGGFAKILFNIFLVLAIGVVIYVLYQLFKDFKINRHTKVESVSTHSEEEDELSLEKLDKNDLETQINIAKQEGNYTLATRYYFLLYLQKLQAREYINYHKDKTNLDYQNEINNQDLHLQFVKVSYLFEYVWYGKKPLNRAGFEQLESTFLQQIDLVK